MCVCVCVCVCVCARARACACVVVLVVGSEPIAQEEDGAVFLDIDTLKLERQVPPRPHPARCRAPHAPSLFPWMLAAEGV